MREEKLHSTALGVQDYILTIRGQKVMLDADLARVYGVTTKRLNEQVKRNKDRFPSEFMFRLNQQEVEHLNRSQFATGSQKHRDPRLSPYAFTEHGALMAANVLNSPQAIEMSVFIIKAFIQLREKLAATAPLEKRLNEIEKNLISHDIALRELYQKIKPLLLGQEPPKPKRKIGFTAEENRAVYRVR